MVQVIPLLFMNILVTVKEPVALPFRILLHKRRQILTDKKRMIPELLAPAGSFEGLVAALGAGADAVYLGGSAFGARAYARNFDEEELLRAIDLCHIHGRKLYLTVNTLMKNREIRQDLIPYILPYVREGIDAVLVQDLGAARVLRRYFPDLPLHASTQMAVTGPEGMAMLEELGFTRVVPARELSLAEIRQMHERSSLEIETFVHGAMCYSYSGMCLMSSLIGGRSGNRGRCAQPCRLEYRGKAGGRETKPVCLLSMKDLNTLDLIPELAGAGIASLKIEGRMKQPSYTAGVTAVYRKYLDLLRSEGEENYHVEQADRERLLALFSRGGSGEGYYHQHNGKNMIYFYNAEKKEQMELPSPAVPKRAVRGEILLRAGEPMRLEASAGDIKVQVLGACPSPARNQPATGEGIRKQLLKTGETEFQWEELKVRLEGDLFIPVKELNELRRHAFRELTEELVRPWRREISAQAQEQDGARGSLESEGIQDGPQEENPPVYVSCETWEAAAIALDFPGVKGLYLPMDLAERGLEENTGKEIYLSLPYIVRGKTPSWLPQRLQSLTEKGLAGFIVHNLEGFALMKRLGFADRCVADHALYSWNDEAAAFWRDYSVLRMTAPVELNAGELSHRDNRSSELLVYGYLPAMVSAQCVRQDIDHCDKKSQRAALTDRYGNTFTAQCVCFPWKSNNTKEEIPCYNMIYNCLPFSLLKEMEDVRRLGMASWRIHFTIEKQEEVKEILEAFFSSRLPGRGEKPERPVLQTTKGHFRRGVE